MDPETIDQLVNVGIRLRTHQSANVGEPPEERVEHQLRRLMACVADVTIDISEDLREVMRGYNGTQNTFGESQIKLDVLADHRLMKHLEQETSFQVRQLASEESDEIKTLSTGDGRYSVTFDPLDGSSVVDANFSVGTIVGFYEGDLLDGKPGRESLAGAMYVLYGPATTLVYAVPGEGAHEFVLRNGRFILEKEHLQMQEQGKIYGPGANVNKWLPEHREFIKDIQRQGHRLRYSGALVADANHIFSKGGGIFAYPVLTDAPRSKLRLLFELQPLALIAEEMGGAATDGITPILDLVPKKLEERSPIYIGSRREVELAKEYLTGQRVS
ncbi:fructose-bisphosphatase class I [archaeon]|nr:fructose-bisphosphatase class I [archaeon]|tara:strand:+ start:304 stop:1290 length:987 start_codon:yes stop_codon:yes gene_type:complete